MQTMATSICGERLSVLEVSRWIYQEEEDCCVPPAFVLVISQVQVMFTTNDTRIVGCVSYRPEDISLSEIPSKYNGLIYAVRLKTMKTLPSLSGGYRNTVYRTIYCDAYIYSNPLLRTYRLLKVYVRSNEDWSVKVVNLDPNNLKLLKDFKESTGDRLYKQFRREISMYDVDLVARDTTGSRLDAKGMLSNPMLLTRDIWDLVSLGYPDIVVHITKAHLLHRLDTTLDDLKSNRRFPDVAPLFFVMGVCDGHIHIVRCLEACTGVVYDVHFTSCLRNTTVGVSAVRYVADVYSQFAYIPTDRQCTPQVF